MSHRRQSAVITNSSLSFAALTGGNPERGKAKFARAAATSTMLKLTADFKKNKRNIDEEERRGLKLENVLDVEEYALMTTCVVTLAERPSACSISLSDKCVRVQGVDLRNYRTYRDYCSFACIASLMDGFAKSNNYIVSSSPSDIGSQIGTGTDAAAAVAVAEDRALMSHSKQFWAELAHSMRVTGTFAELAPSPLNCTYYDAVSSAGRRAIVVHEATKMIDMQCWDIRFLSEVFPSFVLEVVLRRQGGDAGQPRAAPYRIDSRNLRKLFIETCVDGLAKTTSDIEVAAVGAEAGHGEGEEGDGGGVGGGVGTIMTTNSTTSYNIDPAQFFHSLVGDLVYDADTNSMLIVCIEADRLDQYARHKITAAAGRKLEELSLHDLGESMRKYIRLSVREPAGVQEEVEDVRVKGHNTQRKMDKLIAKIKQLVPVKGRDHVSTVGKEPTLEQLMAQPSDVDSGSELVTPVGEAEESEEESDMFPAPASRSTVEGESRRASGRLSMNAGVAGAGTGAVAGSIAGVASAVGSLMPTQPAGLVQSSRSRARKQSAASVMAMAQVEKQPHAASASYSIHVIVESLRTHADARSSFYKREPIVSVLTDCAFLTHCMKFTAERDLVTLATYCTVKEVSSGTTFHSIGDYAQHCYIVLKGTVAVMVEAESAQKSNAAVGGSDTDTEHATVERGAEAFAHDSDAAGDVATASVDSTTRIEREIIEAMRSNNRLTTVQPSAHHKHRKVKPTSSSAGVSGSVSDRVAEAEALTAAEAEAAKLPEMVVYGELVTKDFVGEDFMRHKPVLVGSDGNGNGNGRDAPGPMQWREQLVASSDVTLCAIPIDVLLSSVGINSDKGMERDPFTGVWKRSQRRNTRGTKSVSGNELEDVMKLFWKYTRMYRLLVTPSFFTQYLQDQKVKLIEKQKKDKMFTDARDSDSESESESDSEEEAAASAEGGAVDKAAVSTVFPLFQKKFVKAQKVEEAKIKVLRALGDVIPVDDKIKGLLEPLFVSYPPETMLPDGSMGFPADVMDEHTGELVPDKIPGYKLTALVDVCHVFHQDKRPRKGRGGSVAVGDGSDSASASYSTSLPNPTNSFLSCGISPVVLNQYCPDVIHSVRLRVFQPNTEIFQQNDPRHYFYLILNGECSFHRWLRLDDNGELFCPPPIRTGSRVKTGLGSAADVTVPVSGTTIRHYEIGVRVLGGDFIFMDGETSSWVKDSIRKNSDNLIRRKTRKRSDGFFDNHKHSLVGSYLNCVMA